MEIIRLLFPEKRLLLADSGLLTRDIMIAAGTGTWGIAAVIPKYLSL